jgi:radical SAM superfamily enzyme YgiQ (UPF0313 family)
MKVKIYLIEPIVSNNIEEIVVSTPNQESYGSKVPSGIWEPYSIECIGSFLKYNIPSIDIQILQENIYNHENIVSKLAFTHGLNIVCISTYSYTADHVLDIFNKIKKINNDVVTVSGGYHPSGDYNFCKNSCIDYCIFGEGEIPLLNLINSLMDDNFEINENNKIDMKNEYCWPIRHEKFLKRAKSFPLAVPVPYKQMNSAMISFSRGCIYNCSFCASSLIWSDNNSSYRGIYDVMDEIRYLKRNFNTNHLFWTDLAINNSKKKLYGLLDNLIDIKDICSFGYANQKLDKKTAFKLQKAGFRRLGFGVEALENKRLEVIKQFQKFNYIKNALSAADENGIITRGYIMMGFPDEEPEDTYKILDTIIELPIDQLRLGFYTPFVGTSSYEEHYSNLTDNVNRFTADLPVFKNHIRKEKEWLKVREDVLIKYYNNELYEYRIKEKINDFPYLKESFDYFFKVLNLGCA